MDMYIESAARVLTKIVSKCIATVTSCGRATHERVEQRKEGIKGADELRIISLMLSYVLGYFGVVLMFSNP